jgi:hypothetical protein
VTEFLDSAASKATILQSKRSSTQGSSKIKISYCSVFAERWIASHLLKVFTTTKVAAALLVTIKIVELEI